MEQWGRDINDSSARSVPLTQDATGKLSQLLADANRLLLARQFDAVVPLLHEALALDPNNANALFGMGQLSAQAQQFERALDFYGRAAANASPAESWIAAWSHVRRGSIFSFQDQTGKAREEWNRVLGMSGDLRGALEAARKALEQK